MYLFSPSVLAFYPEEFKKTYEDAGTLPSDVVVVDDAVRNEFNFTPPKGKKLGVVDNFPAWVDIPPTPNSELRKVALSTLSTIYQEDIEKLNRAWLAAAVNDGEKEPTKKDAVVAQINARKSQYATDRAAIIAQYP